MIRLRAALCIFMLSALCLTPPSAAGDYVIELPVLAAIRANDKGVFEMLMIWWDRKQSPEPIQLQWLDAGVHLGEAKQTALAQAFAYAVERTPNVRHSGTASVRGFAYASTTSDGPSAGAAMAVGFIALFKGDRLQRGIAMTGTLEPGGRIGPV